MSRSHIAVGAALLLCAFGGPLGGCVGETQRECFWGILCPTGTVCYEPLQSCERPEHVGACRDLGDYAPCLYPGAPADAVCRDGVCISPRCGDGRADPGEVCDGSDLRGATCAALSGGAQSGPLACRGDCGALDIVGCHSVTWVPLPAGTFDMGSATGEADEGPIHPVAVPAFELALSEVTVAQYALCVASGACTAPDAGPLCNWGEPGFEDHPVNCVDWPQAAAFCAAVGGRLPSEAEWEYAARSAGRDIAYPWGDQGATCALAVMDDGGGLGCGTGGTLPVCSRPAGHTAQGLCDLAGNLWEWQQDHYHPTYDNAPADGRAWEEAAGGNRTRHGGAFITAPEHLRAANRGNDDPLRRTEFTGFRCAR